MQVSNWPFQFPIINGLWGFQLFPFLFLSFPLPPNQSNFPDSHLFPFLFHSHSLQLPHHQAPMEKPLLPKCSQDLWFGILMSFFLCFVFLSFDYSSFWGVNNGASLLVNSQGHQLVFVKNQTSFVGFVKNQTTLVTTQSSPDSCSGRYVYIHDELPSKFNSDLLNNCRILTRGTDKPNLCPYFENWGFGPEIENTEGVLANESWFSTNQFTLEVIFHNKMKHYKCLTKNSTLASAIYVPFYAGLDASLHLWDSNLMVRDASARDLNAWLSKRPEWRTIWGRDHFLIGGRIAWDFRRQTDEVSDWGSKLRFLPESMNMSMLSVEGSSWRNDYAIPYPTNFHPAKDGDVVQWQNRMRKLERPHLFTFVGAPRPDQQNSIRGKIIDQCLNSSVGKLVDCSSDEVKCDNPASVMWLFQSSVYCLQPTGDSYTRKSAFDSILAGCIPVFFHPGTAYSQYLWHLPKNHTKYSVFIPVRYVEDLKEGLIERTLVGILKERELEMREEVIRLIPKLVYADPMSRLETDDAFDLSVKGILETIENVRKVIRDGGDPSIGFADEDSYKYTFPKTLD